MNRELAPSLPARSVMRLLWATARRRATGRAARQREIMGRRNKASTFSSGALARLLGIVLVCFVHATLAWFAIHSAEPAAQADGERSGRIVVTDSQWHLVEELAADQQALVARQDEFAALARPRPADRWRVSDAERRRDHALTRLANVTRPAGRSDQAGQAEYQAQIERVFREHGVKGFMTVDGSLAGQLRESRHAPAAIIPVLSFIVAGWLCMLVCQGEGLELDVQRRRHPMWEWLLSHPIQPAHAFYAELLSPLMTNPIYFAAPIFFWVLLGDVFDVGVGLVAAVLIGLPLAVTTSCLNKAIETTALLRLSTRTRGAVLGVLSWIGYVAMILPFLLLQSDLIGQFAGRFGAWFESWFPAWPVRALVIGWGDTPSFGAVLLSWWIVVLALGGLALWATHQATSQGMQAPSGGTTLAGGSWLSAVGRFGRNPVQRKELLWLLRDKGAVVQVVLVPLTIAATQAFNFRGLYHLAGVNWSSLCGLAIICGTYFLLVLGPRSLASEGPALWLALTWPRGLEDLLKAKARLWSRVATFVVGCVLVIATLLFPGAWWKIVLVGCGWLFFSSTLALKSVSLVTAPSSSGEPEPPSRSKSWIAMIGTLAFGTGVITQSWPTAIIGIVFSSLVGVAMWQGLRARLPYLFDPWSEEPVPAPSLLHASVGIALLVEFIGVATAIAASAGGPSSLWLARAVGYGMAGAVGCVLMHRFLARRGVSLASIIHWDDAARRFDLVTGLGLAILGGAALALFASIYQWLLRFIPAAREALDEAAKFEASHHGQLFWILLLTTGFAPVAEEYFFRGLLFRTLDRDLGGWRALVLSAAFFAICHPPMAWIPVAGVGLFSAWLFRSSRHLGPSVVCHVTYNAAVVLIGIGSH